MHDHDPTDKPAQLPEPDDSPKFGRLLIVLVLAVLLIAGLTFMLEALYS